MEGRKKLQEESEDPKLDLNEYLSSINLLNNIKANLENQVKQSNKSKVVLQPRIAESHVRPNLYKSIALYIILGIASSLILIFTIEAFKDEPMQSG